MRLSKHAYKIGRSDARLFKQHHLSALEYALQILPGADPVEISIDFDNARRLDVDSFAQIEEEPIVKAQHIIGVDMAIYSPDQRERWSIQIDKQIHPAWVYVLAKGNEADIDRFQAKLEEVLRSTRPWYHVLFKNSGFICLYALVTILLLIIFLQIFKNFAPFLPLYSIALLACGLSLSLSGIVSFAIRNLFPGLVFDIGASKSVNARQAAIRRFFGVGTATVILGMVVRSIVTGKW